MLTRKENSTIGQTMPQEWKDHVVSLLNSVYQDQCDEHKKEFDAFGFIYPEEILIVVSFIDKNQPHNAPTSCFLSCDHRPGSKTEKLVNKLLDAAGVFFDNYFVKADWDDFFDFWEEITIDQEVIYFKVTREDVNLTLQADELLAKFPEEKP